MQSEMQKPSDKLKTARHTFSTIGLAALLLLVGQLAVGLLVGYGTQLFFPTGNCPDWLILLVTYLAVYVVVFPIAALPLRRLPAVAPEAGKLSFRHFLVFLPILYLCSYVGSILGNLASMLAEDAFSLRLTDDLDLLFEGERPVLLLITAVLAPVCEELFFRKLLIDRTRAYGEKLAIFAAALVFALYHTNIYQFFYTLFIGLVLGYIYLRTGKVSLTIVLHAIFNLFGGILASEVMRIGNAEAFLAAETVEEQMLLMAENPIGIFLLCAYSLLCILLLISGCILLGKYRKKIFFKPAARQLPPDTEGAAAFVNIGMLLYIAISAAAAFFLGNAV